jgi:hypothetical protein
LLGGNDYRVKPQFGRQDASKGCLCKGRRTGEAIVFEECRMLSLNGQVRNFSGINENQIIIGLNDDKIQWYELD